MTPELANTTTPAAEGAARPGPNAWSLAALATPVLLSSLGAGIANVGLPTLADAFDASFHAVQWVVLAYLLAITTLIVGVGRLADLVGRRRLLLGGLALFTVASLASASAPALWVLVTARAAQGLGAAVMMTLAMALVGDATPPERTGRAMGVLGSMSAVGTALGPAVGGLLLEVAGWRGLFFVNVPLGALALLLAYRHLPPDRRLRDVGRAAFDLPGTLLLALALGAYALAMTAGRGQVGYLNAALLLLAALGGAAFVRSQARSQSPLLHLGLLRGGTLGAQLLVSVVTSAVVMATLVVGPFYLARGLGLAPAVIGGVLSVGPLVSAAAGVPAGRLVDRLGARGSIAVGLAGMAAGSVLLAALSPSLGITGYVLPIAALTASYALVQAANNAAAMMDVRADGRGVVAALLGLSRNLGLVTGASAMGAVFALASGVPEVAAASPGAAAAGLRVTFALAAALVSLTLAVVVRGAWVRAVGTALVVMSVGATVVRAQAAPTTVYPGPAASPVDPYDAGHSTSRWIARSDCAAPTRGSSWCAVRGRRTSTSTRSGSAARTRRSAPVGGRAATNAIRTAHAVWRDTPFFSDRERAALGWAESVTCVADTHVPDDAWEAVRVHFSSSELVDLTLLVAAMNAWNRFAVAFRKQPVWV